MECLNIIEDNSKTQFYYFKEIMQLAWPNFLTNILFIFFDIGNKAIIGRLPLEQIALSSLISSYIYYITGSFGIVSIAYTIMLTKQGGGVQKEKADELRAKVMGFGGLIGIIIFTVHLLFGYQLLEKIYNITDNRMYYYLIFLSITLCINIFLFIFSAYFKYLRRPKVVFVNVLVSSIVNLTFDYLFVFGKLGFPKLEVIGSSIGAIIGLSSGLSVYLFYYKKYNNRLPKINFDWGIYKELFRIYVPLFLIDCLESSVFLLFVSFLVAKLPQSDISIYSCITTLMGVTLFPIMAVSSGAALLFGQSSKNITEAKIFLLWNRRIVLFMCVIMGLVMTFLGSQAVRLITDQTIIIQGFIIYLPIITFIYMINSLQNNIRSFLYMLNFENWVCKFSIFTHVLGIILIFGLFNIAKLYGILAGLIILFFILYIGYEFKLYNSYLKK